MGDLMRRSYGLRRLFEFFGLKTDWSLLNEKLPASVVVEKMKQEGY